MAETIIGRHQEQKLLEEHLRFFIHFFFCACHLNAQEQILVLSGRQSLYFF